MQLRYYLGVEDPSTLTDEEWATMALGLAEIRKQEAQMKAKELEVMAKLMRR